MIDGEMYFYDQPSQSSLRKFADGRVTCYKSEGNGSKTMTYNSDGLITIERSEGNGEPFLVDGKINPDYSIIETRVSYYPNGTILAEIKEETNAATDEQNETQELINGNFTVQIGNLTNPWKIIENYNASFTYEELWNVRAFQTHDEAAERFIQGRQSALGQYKPKRFPYLTSDYVLYWFDYKAGYDVVMAQLGWNHTTEQDIALVRGAGNLQNKTWGTIITWKYNHPPYLDSGEGVYNQMKASYEAGADYIAVFNYAENMTGPYGTLQKEHFDALERFWNEVVQTNAIRKGSVEAEAVLVLPENYGWGMRDYGDKIWVLWGPDENSQQIWNRCQSLLEEYGFGLDIVYEYSEFPVEGKYSQTYYWNQAG
jgi:hypothetical protein